MIDKTLKMKQPISRLMQQQQDLGRAIFKIFLIQSQRKTKMITKYMKRTIDLYSDTFRLSLQEYFFQKIVMVMYRTTE